METAPNVLGNPSFPEGQPPSRGASSIAESGIGGNSPRDDVWGGRGTVVWCREGSGGAR